jgi:hypothetical protein
MFKNILLGEMKISKLLIIQQTCVEATKILQYILELSLLHSKTKRWQIMIPHTKSGMHLTS